MNYTKLYVCLLLLLFSACNKSGKKDFTPAEYSQKMIDLKNSVSNKMEELIKSANIILDKVDSDTLTENEINTFYKSVSDLNYLIDSNLYILELMPEYDNDIKVRNAFVDYHVTLKHILNSEFSQISSLIQDSNSKANSIKGIGIIIDVWGTIILTEKDLLKIYNKFANKYSIEQKNIPVDWDKEQERYEMSKMFYKKFNSFKEF